MPMMQRYNDANNNILVTDCKDVSVLSSMLVLPRNFFVQKVLYSIRIHVLQLTHVPDGFTSWVNRRFCISAPSNNA